MRARAIANQPLATFGPLGDRLELRKDTITRLGKPDESGTYPLTGVTARMEEGEALRERITLTRVALIGIFALGATKKTGGTSFLTIEGPGFFWAVEVDRKKKNEAMQFLAKINNQVKQAAAD